MANGEDVARASIPTPPPEELLVPQRLPDGTSVFAARARHSRARSAPRDPAHDRLTAPTWTVWRLSTIDGGTCYRAYYRGSGCPPLGYEQTEPMAGSLASGSNPMLLARRRSDEPSPLSSSATRTEAPDGSRPPTDVALTEVRPEHYPRGHRLKLVIALDRNGRELQQQEVRDDVSTGTYPCDAGDEIDIGLGRDDLPMRERAPVGGARSSSPATSMRAQDRGE